MQKGEIAHPNFPQVFLTPSFLNTMRLVPEKSWPFISELSSMKISILYTMICKNLLK